MIGIKALWMMFTGSRAAQIVALVLALGALALMVRSWDRQRTEAAIQADRDQAALEALREAQNASEAATLNQMERQHDFEQSQGNLAGAVSVDDYFARLRAEQTAKHSKAAR